MKILITGASGFIGGEALTQCLNHPKVSNVVAFVRRDLPAELQDNPKLECVVIKDFAEWPIDVLEQHADAEGMIWYATSLSPMNISSTQPLLRGRISG